MACVRFNFAPKRNFGGPVENECLVLIDGHHKMRAAANVGGRCRVIAFSNNSLDGKANRSGLSPEIERVLKRLDMNSTNTIIADGATFVLEVTRIQPKRRKVKKLSKKSRLPTNKR